MKLIDKDALVAEIERRVNAYQKNFDKSDNKIARLSIDGRIAGLKALLSFISTLEVKEVDLESNVDKILEEHDWNYNKIDFYKFAKHFFELGLQSQRKSISFQNIDDVLKEFGVDPYSREAKMLKESYYAALDKLLEEKGE